MGVYGIISDAMEMNGRATERYIPRRDRDRPLSGGMMIAKSLPIATPAIPDRMAVEKSEQVGWKRVLLNEAI